MRRFRTDHQSAYTVVVPRLGRFFHLHAALRPADGEEKACEHQRYRHGEKAAEKQCRKDTHDERKSADPFASPLLRYIQRQGATDKPREQGADY
jgi:hypothetical protein